MNALFCVLLTGPAALAAPAPFAKTARQTDLDRIQGEWVWHGLVTGGGVARITGDEIRWHVADPSGAIEKILLHPKANPKRIDLTPINSQSQICCGIYQLDGDVLTICTASHGRPPPTSFAVDRHESFTYTLRRKR